MSSPLFYSQDGNARFKKRKARFSFSEVHIMLDEVKKHRHILVGNYERGAGAARRKRTWAKITARVNEIGECQREVIEIVKKWSDLKCDTKRKLSAMRTGIISHRGLSSRSTRDLNPTERIVFEILQMDNPGETSGGDYSPLGEDADGLEEEDLMEEEDLVAFGSPLNGEMTSMPPPPSTYSLSTQAFRFPQDDPLVANYSGSPYPEVPSLDDRQSDRHSDTLQLPPAATAQPSLTRPSPFSAILPEADGPLQDAMLQSATLSLREQHATNLMLETVSRSLELLSESVQQLAESQREFVRESLRLQCETVQVLRDFAGGAVALMHDKLNGRPAL